ncbi:MAG: DNA topoisomerase I, partial [bacterium]
MDLKKGRWGQFLACTGYPDCKTTRKIAASAIVKKPDVPLEAACPQCSKNLVLREGRFGEFVACSSYPECKYIKQDTIGVKCPSPNCGGEIVRRKSKRGKFYGCNQYPTCKNVYWYKPILESCPTCNAALLFEKVNKRDGQIYYCGDKECGYLRVITSPESGNSEEVDKTK